MGFIDDIRSSGKVTVDDYLPWTDLSVERALSVLPEHLRQNYGTAWQWFIEHSDTSGSRMWGKRIPGVSGDFAISAVRGIHVPTGSPYAVSVTVKRGSIYSGTDRPLVPLPNKTWVLEYSEHRNNTGGETSERWNEGLLACLKDGIPVGVFIGVGGSSYLRYLAFVEEYHPDRGIFTLHGPVTTERSGLFAADTSFCQSRVALEYMSPALSELEEDRRRFAEMRSAVRTGQGRFRERLLDAYDGRCACSGCSVTEALQAAHIIEYRGQRSNVVTNGLLLRADLHLLFDNSLITVKPESYEIITSTRLDGTEYEGLYGRRLRPPRHRSLMPNKDYLSAHYRKFVQLERPVI